MFACTQPQLLVLKTERGEFLLTTDNNIILQPLNFIGSPSVSIVLITNNLVGTLFQGHDPRAYVLNVLTVP